MKLSAMPSTIRRPALPPLHRLRLAAALGALALAAAASAGLGHRGQAFDVLIAGGRVMDGTGNPAFPADVGVRGGRIAAVGRLEGARAARRIDARGKVVVPGFIDLHSHADEPLARDEGFRSPDPRRRAAPNLVAQGVTTVVTNQDGRSSWPIAEQRAALERLGIGANAVLLVGHGTVRALAMGSDFRRPATDEEVARMRALVRQGMREGAHGLSAGLEYEPGRHAGVDELAALAGELVPFGGVYVSHQRSEGPDPLWYWPSQDPPGPPTLLDAVRETIEIGERSGARVVASHLKVKGAHYWGSGGAAVQLIERARARGVDVWADQYPYNTSGTDGGTILIPLWALGVSARLGDVRSGRPAAPPDFSAALRATLADTAAAARARRDVAHEIARRGGAENVVVFAHPDSSVVGRSLRDVASGWGVTPVEAAFRLQLTGEARRPGGGRMRGFSMDEADMETIARQPWVATASDAGVALPEDGPAVHARFYGTFPRKVRRYALERGVLRVEDAIRSMTSLPAQILGLKDRGQVREGLAADLVVLDLAHFRDEATFTEPHRYPSGVDYVIVGGQFVVDGGRLTGALPGRVLVPHEGR
jgi:N-acyl-D-amino-acid deacylase